MATLCVKFQFLWKKCAQLDGDTNLYITFLLSSSLIAFASFIMGRIFSKSSCSTKSSKEKGIVKGAQQFREINEKVVEIEV